MPLQLSLLADFKRFHDSRSKRAELMIVSPDNDPSELSARLQYRRIYTNQFRVVGRAVANA